MKRFTPVLSCAIAIATIGFAARALRGDTNSHKTLTGAAAFASYLNEKPGTFRKITVADLPAPYATTSANNDPSRIIPRPANAWPQAPHGFQVQEFASGFDEPRLMRTAPNGDVFLADSSAGKIIVFHGVTKDGNAEVTMDFATALKRPFGISFYPPGKDPQYVYVGNTDSSCAFRIAMEI